MTTCTHCDRRFEGPGLQGIGEQRLCSEECAFCCGTRCLHVRRLVDNLRLRLEIAERRLREMSEVPCVKHPDTRRWPMKCLPKDPCSFCRAREAVKNLEAAT